MMSDLYARVAFIYFSRAHVTDIMHEKYLKLENMAIANTLQLVAARRRAIRFNFAALGHAKFEVSQPIHWRLIAFYCSCVTLRCDLNFDPVALTFDL